MKLNLFIFSGLFFVSMKAFSAGYCEATPESNDIVLENITIPPGTEVGDVVARSSMISKTIVCKGAPYNLVAYTDTSMNRPTGVYVDFPTTPSGEAYSEKCEAMESGFPGLGIAWVNFNTNTNKWQCVSINQNGFVARGLGKGDTSATVYDQIILVKTGPIGNQSEESEVFDFNKTFQFNERRDAPGDSYLPDFGILYNVILKGNTVIQAPLCVTSSASDSFGFATLDAVNKTYTTSPSQIIDVKCTGVIENGTIASFKPLSDHGVFLSDNNYFATSDSGLGVSVAYTTNKNPTSKIIKPNDSIDVEIENNEATINLRYMPYVKENSGNHPYEKDILFDLKLSNGD